MHKICKTLGALCRRRGKLC